MNEADAIITDFIAKGSASNPRERMLALIRDDRPAIVRFVRRALDDLPRGSWLVDGALSFLSDAEFAEVVDVAIRKLAENSESEVASNIIAYASLQLPHVLTQHLLACWALRLNQGMYYEPWPWRGADDAEVSRLLAVGKSGGDDAELAWRCLLETRRPSLVTTAARALSGHTGYDDWLKQVGFTQDGDTVAPLHPPSVWHIQFPDGYFEDGERSHPTWSCKPIEAPVPTTFGGSANGTCPFCRGSLHHLFELPQHVVGVALNIVTCLSCLGWEESVLFYKHDLSGMPVGQNPDQRQKKPRFTAGPLRSTRAHLVKLSNRWEVQDCALGRDAGENLNRVGGEPCWIQHPEYPACLSCSKTMGFLAQLDSNSPTAPGRWWLWGSGGICYIYWCEACRISALLWQCT